MLTASSYFQCRQPPAGHNSARDRKRIELYAVRMFPALVCRKHGFTSLPGSPGDNGIRHCNVAALSRFARDTLSAEAWLLFVCPCSSMKQVLQMRSRCGCALNKLC